MGAQWEVSSGAAGDPGLCIISINKNKSIAANVLTLGGPVSSVLVRTYLSEMVTDCFCEVRYRIVCQ